MKPFTYSIRNSPDKYTKLNETQRPSFAQTYAEYNGGVDQDHDPADYYRTRPIRAVKVG
jgi:hypothetical protein